MKDETRKKMNEIVAAARAGREVFPMAFQPGPMRGRSNTVSAAIRQAKKLGLIEQCGVDGCGKPKYRAVIPAATHCPTKTLN